MRLSMLRSGAGCFYFSMMAGVFAAFTVEAFLNHLGQRKVKDWEVFERKLGPREKLLLLQQSLHLTADQGQRPFQTLRDMLRLRDALAHGKTEIVTTDEVVADPYEPTARYPEPDWKRLCDLASVARMVEDAEAIVRDLHTQTGSNGDPFESQGTGAPRWPVWNERRRRTTQWTEPLARIRSPPPPTTGVPYDDDQAWQANSLRMCLLWQAS